MNGAFGSNRPFLSVMESDRIIDKARQELANLEARCAEIRSFITLYENFKASASTEAVDASACDGQAAPIEPPKSAPSDAVISAVHDILAKRGDALTLTAIFDALVERGVVIGGKNPKQNLSQKLSSHPQLKSYGKRGWYFADTLPPCMQPNVRLSNDDWEIEEGPTTGMARPSYSNGETDFHSV